MIGTDFSQAAELLRAEQLVAIPTETVYGLAGNAFSEQAVTDIFRVKNRPYFDPLIVHTSSVDRLTELVENIPPALQLLADALMPGPLTLLLPKRAQIPDLVTAGLPQVAVRIPKHPMALQLLEMLEFPLAAPSANPFGYISPTNAEHVARQLGEKVPYILDGGPCTVGLESTIVGLDEEGEVTIFRKGGIPIERIEEIIGGKVRTIAHSSSNPAAPGMLKSHYAPRVPLMLGNLNALAQQHRDKNIGVLSFQERVPGIPDNNQIVLSPAGDFGEAARRLFAAMRVLDEMHFDLIIAELLPDQDLGRAVNDRLRRAAAV